MRSGPGFTSMVPDRAKMTTVMACLDESGRIGRRLRARTEMAAGSLCNEENSMVAVLGR